MSTKSPVQNITSNNHPISHRVLEWNACRYDVVGVKRVNLARIRFLKSVQLKPEFRVGLWSKSDRSDRVQIMAIIEAVQNTSVQCQ